MVAPEGEGTRLRLQIRGLVQGVGFRPFVYRLAHDLRLGGWVKNDSRGVIAEIEGWRGAVGEFETRLQSDLRPPARIDELVVVTIPCEGATEFAILPSSGDGAKETPLLADMAPCVACLAEIRQPGNRRHAYPFTNCTHCGPRFTIIRGVPYDRPNTTMVGFRQCADCQREYDEPADRRFHAQPNACPACGPQVTLVSRSRELSLTGGVAIAAAADALRQGQILALQGVGGFQLIVDGRHDEAVQKLRQRKHRWEKPLAIMVGDLAQAEALGVLGPDERALLASPEAPIVLVRRRSEAHLAAAIAPGNPYLGLMLPSSPLHHLLLANLAFPVVATSGNLSEEPICIDPVEAQRRLGAIADHFLVHDRPIERHADDSVAAVIAGQAQLFRRARGYAPLPLLLGSRGPAVLALGGHLKNTIALAIGDSCFVSQHIGDLDGAETRATCLRVIADFIRLYDARPAAVVHDLHPDYASSQIAEELTSGNGMLAGTPRLAVQHHHAHLASCLADVGTSEPALGIIWDGSGLGADRTLWGGEFLFGNAAQYERVACLHPFLLPGGDRAARSPRRIAAAMLYQFLGAAALENRGLGTIAACSDEELRLLRTQIDKGILCPYTSSVGRLFDAVAGLLGLRNDISFEGQAAMALEFVADPNEEGAYPLTLVERTMISRGCDQEPPPMPSGDASGQKGVPHPGSAPRFLLDPSSLLDAILSEAGRGVPRSTMAARFHGALVNATVEVASRVGVETVALSGGCFQNRLLLSRCQHALAQHRHRVLVHHQVPPNDGGLALGQVAVARSQL